MQSDVMLLFENSLINSAIKKNPKLKKISKGNKGNQNNFFKAIFTQKAELSICFWLQGFSWGSEWMFVWVPCPAYGTSRCGNQENSCS